MVKCPGCGEDNPPKFSLCGYCGTSLAGPPHPAREVRKTVTIVFCDLKGSTALAERLDPEALREVTDRYFRAMADEITRHGGKIEKYIGDAIMAVFGLPRAHEDDALRAVRSVIGMRLALRRVNEDLMRRHGVALVNRTGVNTGEVVADDDPGASQKLVTGDAVNIAARLEQAAPENEIYIGETTYRLVRDAVEAEAVEALELKGKTRRVPAFRLVSARGLEGSARRIDTPIVGRDAELATLGGAYREACGAASIRMVTVIGDAGVGKSRLVHEVVEHITAGARVLRGRCLPYGDGITFWPLREMVTGAADIRGDDPPGLARSKMLDLVDDPDVANRLAAATGLSPATFPMSELYWAARKFLETLAQPGPVVAVIDDIHWAEPAFLDLLEHLLDAGSNAPVLLLATARHDLLEDRPEWGVRAGSTRLVLQPLSDSASAQVVTNLLGTADLPGDVIERIVDAAEGNPLYVEQMLSMMIDTRALRQHDGHWARADRYTAIAVPPTIQALLEARIDRLARSERAAIEPAAVIGLQFALPAVEALVPEVARSEVGKHLGTLTRKRFIRPVPSAESEVMFGFHHHLVRETIYGALLKRSRASLHADFVRWADRVNAERGRALEFEEILGYHLEQAYRYLCELGPLDDQGIAIGADAARRLSAAGRRAFSRGDMHAAASLYRRATALLAAQDSNRVVLLPELGEVLMELGEFAEARAVLDEAEAAAERISDDALRACARLTGMFVRLYSGEQGDWSSEALRVANAAIPVLERVGAHDSLAAAWRLIGLVHGVAGRYGQAGEATLRYMAHARRAGNERLMARSAMGLSINALFGPTPVPEAIAQCERILAEGLGDREAESIILCVVAQLRAMNGEIDQARTLYRKGRAQLRELGQGVIAASTGLDLARVELLGGDLATAEREVKADFEFLARRGETYFLATIAALLARIVREQGRDGEALELSIAAEGAASADDFDAQALWRSVRAPIVARSGDLAQAETLARAAVDLAGRTEAPVLQADTRSELATVLNLAGRIDEALATIGEAIVLYAAKGDVVSAARSRLWAEQLGLTPARINAARAIDPRPL
jgi:class 3 adenylate cyclase/tetratricopeptide (TPR) repeat protein